MKVRFKDLAHVKEAELEDGQMMVIVGDNGAGKTLLLEAFSYVKDYYQKAGNAIVREFLKNHQKQFSVNIEPHLNLDEMDVETPAQVAKVNITMKDIDEANKSIKKLITDRYTSVISGINKYVLLTDQSLVSFELCGLELFKCTEREFTLHVQNRRGRIHLRLSENNNRFMTTIVPMNSEHIGNEYYQLSLQLDTKSIKDIIAERLLQMFIVLVYRDYFGSSRILYLPSERNLFMNNALKKAASDLEVDAPSKLGRRYSERLFTMSYLDFKDAVESYPKLANDLSSKMGELFGGKVKYGDDGEIISILMDDGSEIRRELFSTKQNRFIPYLLIHLPRNRNSEIIIEEPEAHLSLKSQKELLDYLKPLFEEKRNTFYITTHSDVFFAFLNNIFLKDETIPVRVYELKEKEDRFFYLEEIERTAYGYEIEMFTSMLNELYDETLELQQKNK